LPGDIVDVDDRHVQHGLDTGLCEKIEETVNVAPGEETVHVAKTANIPKATKKNRKRR